MKLSHESNANDPIENLAAKMNVIHIATVLTFFVENFDRLLLRNE